MEERKAYTLSDSPSDLLLELQRGLESQNSHGLLAIPSNPHK